MNIAVLLSAYNGIRYLDEQIKSILNQKGNFNITIFVRDDGSNDGTIDILKKYENENIIRLFIGNNIGSSESFKWLIRKVKNFDYYALADQDDVWELDKIDRAVKFFKSDKSIILYGSNKKIVDKNLMPTHVKDNTYHTGFYNLIIQGPGIAGCTMVFDNRLRNLFIEAPQNNFYHDALLVILGETFGKVYYDLEGRILYRNHENNVFGSRMNMKSRFLYRIFNISKYSRRTITTDIAKFLNSCDLSMVEAERRSIIKNSLGARVNFSDRINLLFKGGLKTTHRYEYFMYKVGIILGWI